ncbi:MAG: VOC family protein [Actinomycetota bacterium]|nr:VOC family protein [Actinomycetota bacterium]
MGEPLPTVVPMLSYEDCAAASKWLAAAFGFRETFRHTEPDGRVTHVDLVLGDGRVMLGWPGPDYRSPKRHAETCEQARRWLEAPYVVDGVYVQVDNLDEHFRHAAAAGADVLSEPEDVGFGRHYRAADLEGHRWMIAERTGD